MASTVASTFAGERAEGESLSSPFGAALLGGEAESEGPASFESFGGALESPVAEAMATTDESEFESFALESRVQLETRARRSRQALVDEQRPDTSARRRLVVRWAPVLMAGR
jgi:hypothetical protein